MSLIYASIKHLLWIQRTLSDIASCSTMLCHTGLSGERGNVSGLSSAMVEKSIFPLLILLHNMSWQSLP